MTHQSDTSEAGFTVVVDSDRVIHKTESSCFVEGKRYTPFGEVDEAKAHGNEPCTRCFGVNPTEHGD